MNDYDISILNGNDFTITQYYGGDPEYYKNLGLPYHIGIDLISQSGNDWTIESVLGGNVLFAGFKSGGYGNVIIIKQDDNVLAKYMHLDSIFVSEGQRIEQLQEIGVIGNTGNSTGRHLHLELSQWDGNPWSIQNHFDPIPYLNNLDDIYKQAQIQYMNKAQFTEAIKAKLSEPEITNNVNAVNNDDYNYLVAFLGSERIKEVEKINEIKNNLSKELTDIKNTNVNLLAAKTALERSQEDKDKKISELECQLKIVKVTNTDNQSQVDSQVNTIKDLNTSLDNKDITIINQDNIIQDKSKVWNWTTLITGQLRNGVIPALTSLVAFLITLLSSPEFLNIVANYPWLIASVPVAMLVLSQFGQLLKIVGNYLQSK